MKAQGTPIYSNGRVVGEVRGDGYFQKHVRGSIHFLRKPPAIAFDLATLDAAERAGAHSVEIFDDETGLHYRSTLRRVRVKGFRAARGYGEQVALPLREFNRGDADLDAPNVIQSSFWGRAA